MAMAAKANQNAALSTKSLSTISVPEDSASGVPTDTSLRKLFTQTDVAALTALLSSLSKEY